MVPAELDAFMEFEDDELRIVERGRSWTGDGLDLILDLRDGARCQSWSIKCANVRRYRSTGQESTIIEVKEDHALLWEFEGEQCSLYFNGRPSDASTLFIALAAAHKRMFGDELPMTTYLRIIDPENFKPDFGLIAEGPVKALSEYATVLNEHGSQCNFIGSGPAVEWTENGWKAITAKPNVLFLDDDYIVADRFTWTLLD